MKAVFTSNQLDNRIKDNLKSQGYKIINVPQRSSIPSYMSSHADLFIAKVKDTFIFEKKFANQEERLLNDLDIKYIVGSSTIKKGYPHDVKYNVAVLNNSIIGKKSTIDKSLLNYITSQGMNIYDVKQGYANCSIIPIGNKGIITADIGIYKTLKNSLDVLLIQQDHIILGDRIDGFIGGTCGYMDSCTIFFAGDIRQHKSYSEIKSFLSKYNIGIKYVSGVPLEDCGGLFFIEN